MRNSVLLCLVAVVMLAACSTPKYAYYFNHYDYNAGKKKKENSTQAVASVNDNSQNEITVNEEPLKLDEATLTASADESVVAISERPVVKPAAPAKTYKEMSKAERKEVRKEARQMIKSYIKAKKEGDTEKMAELSKAMDHDLKLAAIFGAVGFVCLLLGGAGDAFTIIGAISLIIGVVFFVMWLVRQ